MFTLKIENTRGEIFELTNNEQDYAVVGVSGLTRPDAAINTSSGVSDGEYYNSSKLGMRNIVIDILLRGDIETNRQRLYKIFPLKTACTVYFKNQNRDVRIKGYVEVLDGDLFVEQEQIQISIICPQPYFESLKTLYTELSKIVRMFEFPFSIQVGEPIPFSEIRNLPLCSIVNNGDTECGLILTVAISGEVQDLKIYRAATPQFLGFDYLFQAGDQITINTLNGQKKMILMRDDEEINLLNYMQPGSSWFQIAVGVNDFTFTASNQDLVRIVFATTELFGGV
ncbi:MAG: phage tail family protein [Oscillospiraceae bacterium]|nr:phage tail family protein [Oscillospiraceae bacterium]